MRFCAVTGGNAGRKAILMHSGANSCTTGWEETPPPVPIADGLEILFPPDPTIWDGRYANNGWLQELSKPLTQLVWGNAVLIGPATAERLGLANEDLVELTYQGRRLEAPVWIMPGQADDTLTLHLGYGRTEAGRVGNGHGVNAYQIRTAVAGFGNGLLELRPLEVESGLRLPGLPGASPERRPHRK